MLSILTIVKFHNLSKFETKMFHISTAIFSSCLNYNFLDISELEDDARDGDITEAMTLPLPSLW